MSDIGIYEAMFADILKIFIAMLCGGIIGFERELKDKPAGLRTMILVSTGSCIFVIIGLKVYESFGDDPGRILGPIITGIGFLGAGTIIQARGSVRGLTSAATIWVVAGLGMSVGLGLFLLALTISILVLFILFIAGRIEGTVPLFQIREFNFIVVAKPDKGAIQKVRWYANKMDIRYTNLSGERREGGMRISFRCHSRESDLARLMARLLELDGIIEARLEYA